MTAGDGELWSPISLERRGSWRYRTHAHKWSWDVVLLVFTYAWTDVVNHAADNPGYMK